MLSCFCEPTFDEACNVIPFEAEPSKNPTQVFLGLVSVDRDLPIWRSRFSHMWRDQKNPLQVVCGLPRSERTLFKETRTQVYAAGNFNIPIECKSEANHETSIDLASGVRYIGEWNVLHLRVQIDNVNSSGSAIDRRFQRSIHYNGCIHIGLALDLY